MVERRFCKDFLFRTFLTCCLQHLRTDCFNISKRNLTSLHGTECNSALATLSSAYTLITCMSAQFNATLEQELRTLMLTTNNYDRFVRPDSVVNVTLKCGLYTLNNLDVKSQTMETALFIFIVWKDSRLQWADNPTYNSSVTSFFSNEDYIWVPKLTIPNAVEGVEPMNNDAYPIQVYSDGTIAWLTGKIISTHCECDIRFFPFDTQTCGVVFTTWLYNKQSIQIKAANPAMFMEFYKENGEWEFIRYETPLQDVRSSGIDYQLLNFNFTFRRRPSFYFMNYILVGVLLSWLLCLTFKLTPDSGDKIGFVLTVMLTYTVYLSFVLDNIPRTSQRTSMLATCMVINIIMGVIATAITVFVIKCHSTPTDKPVPRSLKKVIKYFFKPVLCRKENGRVCFCCFKNKKNKKENQVHVDLGEIKHKLDSWVEEDHDACSDDFTWPEVGQMLDDVSYRLCFICLVFIVGLIHILYLIAYVDQTVV